jgi:hypothetical protein
LSHVEPDGEGLAGKRGQYGYTVFMQLILRPALMVFGLIAGYTIFKVTVMFLNEAILYATMGSGAYAGNMGILAKIIYTLIYCAIVVILANQSFSTVGLFPQVALKWLGLGQIQEEKINDSGNMLTGAAMYATNQLASKVPALSGAASSMIKATGPRKPGSTDTLIGEVIDEMRKKTGVPPKGKRRVAGVSQDSQSNNQQIAADSGPKPGQLGAGGDDGPTPVVASNTSNPNIGGGSSGAAAVPDYSSGGGNLGGQSQQGSGRITPSAEDPQLEQQRQEYLAQYDKNNDPKNTA